MDVNHRSHPCRWFVPSPQEKCWGFKTFNLTCPLKKIYISLPIRLCEQTRPLRPLTTHAEFIKISKISKNHDFVCLELGAGPGSHHLVRPAGSEQNPLDIVCKRSLGVPETHRVILECILTRERSLVLAATILPESGSWRVSDKPC